MWAPGRERRRARHKGVADKPHPWTIAVGLLSPVLSVIAVVISLNALWVNERSMKIGQRAYLAIRNARASIGVLEARHQGSQTECRIGIVQQYELQNIGRTPATVIKNVPRIPSPREWDDEHDWHMRKFPELYRGIPELENLKKDGSWLGHVPPDSYRSVFEATAFMIPSLQCDQILAYGADKMAASRAYGITLINTVNAFLMSKIYGEIVFMDVFGETHSIKWVTEPEPSLDRDFEEVFRRYNKEASRSKSEQHWSTVSPRNVR